MRRASATGLLLLAAGLFIALCGWQLQRRVWKLQLISAVNARVHAPPEPAPAPAAWGRVSAAADAYRHVRVHGVLLPGRETLVQALTDLGAGDWVLEPLRTDAGWTVLINRGFVPPERRDPQIRRAAEPSGPVTIVGLLRVTEPKGGFLRRNDPAGDRWYSRDVDAIARKRGLGPVAPYFIDEDATPKPGGYPIGGLTVISFPNSHLAYAVTWLVLAGLSLVGVWVVWRTPGGQVDG